MRGSGPYSFVWVLAVLPLLQVAYAGGQLAAPSSATPPASSAGAGMSRATPPAATQEEATLTVRAGEHSNAVFYFELSTKEVPAGRIVVDFMNEGPNSQHTFNVADAEGRMQHYNSETLFPGDRLTLEFELSQPGTYSYYCILYGHGNRGQVGTFKVVAP